MLNLRGQNTLKCYTKKNYKSYDSKEIQMVN